MRTRLTMMLGAVLLAGGCSTGSSPARTSTPPAPRTSSSVPSTPTTLPVRTTAPPVTSSTPPSRTTPHPPGSPAQRVFDAMSLAERVGQLMMVDCPSTQLSSQAVDAIQRLHVGSVILDRTSYAGQASIKQLTSELEGSNPSPAKLFIATDQEGGQVQRLQGPGFSDIPSGVVQGQYTPDELRQDWTAWGAELHDAGLNVNLAPVVDTVPSGFGPNPPIGHWDRQFGSTPKTVSSHGLAALAGLRAAGIAPTVKHFPGLGRVRGNTDETAGVQDTVTTADDPYLRPFKEAIDAHVPLVMMSTATYTKLDPDVPAAFSKRIIGGLLRKQLGFAGVVISDDVGMAAQVEYLTPGERAVDFIAAGGDIVLTVDPATNEPMVNALLDKAKSDPAFRKLVDAAALRVLTTKQQYGLLG